MKIRLYFALLLMGFTSLLSQTLLIREFLISFYGNELIIGLILANWVILVAMASFLSNSFSLKIFRPISIYSILQAGIALYLPLSIFVIRIIKNILALSLGEGIGILTISLSSFFILAPLSFLIGMQFPFGCRLLSDYSRKPQEAIGGVYILEAIGFIFAGPIFTYLLITQLNSFQIAFILGIFNLLSGILILKNEKNGISKKILSAILNLALVSIIFTFLGLGTKIHSLSINKQWRNQKILAYQNSIYANLVVTQTQQQYNFYSDGVPIITTPVPDLTSVEELIHFTFLSHKNPKAMLILSGGAGGAIRETLKYPVTKVDYAELDPLLINLIKKFPTPITQEELNDSRLNIKYIDGRHFLRLSSSTYDVILLNLPVPSTLQLNRFFTREFFKDVKSHLKPEGIFALRIPGSLSYISQDLRNLNGSILNTLKSEFPSVKIIPGDLNLYLASKSDFEISPQIFISRIKERNIATHLITLSYLNYRLDSHWLNWFRKAMSDISKIRRNLDLRPSAVFYTLSYWNAQFSPKLQNFFRLLERLNFGVLILFIGFMGVFLFIFQRTIKSKNLPFALAISTTGFMGMSINLILIFAYQSFYGFVFSQLALLITAFMTGLSLGGWFSTHNLSKIKNETNLFSKIELSIIGFCLILSPLLIYLNKIPATNLSFIFYLLSCLCGFFVGLEFPLANKIYMQNKRSSTPSGGILYALDLLGAFVANLVVSVALVPIIGIIKTCMLLIFLKLISLALIRLSAAG